MIKATSVELIPRLSLRKRKANHLLSLSDKVGTKQKTMSAENRNHKRDFPLFSQAGNHALDSPPPQLGSESMGFRIMIVMAISSFTSVAPRILNSHNIQTLRITAQSIAVSGWKIEANAEDLRQIPGVFL